MLGALMIFGMLFVALCTAWGGVQLLITKLNWNKYGDMNHILGFVSQHVSPLTSGMLVTTMGSVSGLLLGWLAHAKVGVANLELNIILSMFVFFFCPALLTAITLWVLGVIVQRKKKNNWVRSEFVVFEILILGRLGTLMHVVCGLYPISAGLLCFQLLN